MSNFDNRIATLTPESIERLQLVNEIRDRLEQASDSLFAHDVIQIYGFGSSINGTAKIDSDIDIAIVRKNQDGLGFGDKYKKTKDLEQILTPIFSELNMSGEEINYQYHRPQKSEDGRVIHLSIGDSQKNDELPHYIEDPLLLWEKTEETSHTLKRTRQRD